MPLKPHQMPVETFSLQDAGFPLGMDKAAGIASDSVLRPCALSFAERMQVLQYWEHEVDAGKVWDDATRETCANLIKDSYKTLSWWMESLNISKDATEDIFDKYEILLKKAANNGTISKTSFLLEMNKLNSGQIVFGENGTLSVKHLSTKAESLHQTHCVTPYSVCKKYKQLVEQCGIED